MRSSAFWATLRRISPPPTHSARPLGRQVHCLFYIEEEAKNALVARFDSILTDNGATVVESKDWEKRRLAYEIQDFREGLYHVVNVEANDDAALNEFDRLSKINGDILRHMIVKLDA